jgi:hypothetical protein
MAPESALQEALPRGSGRTTTGAIIGSGSTSPSQPLNIRASRAAHTAAKWAVAKQRNSVYAANDLDELSGLGFNVSEAREALNKYKGTVRKPRLLNGK